MRRVVPVVALIAAIGLSLVALSAAEAREQTTKVTCTQVPQNSQMKLDEQFIAQFMSEQLSEGRSRFESIGGSSTVLCAW